MAGAFTQELHCAGITSLPAAIIDPSIPTLVYATAQLSLNTGPLYLTLLSLSKSKFLNLSCIKTNEQGEGGGKGYTL